jgi:hypothetical protein
MNLESEGQARYAVIPLDDALIDYLVEHNARFIDVCRQIRAHDRRTISFALWVGEDMDQPDGPSTTQPLEIRGWVGGIHRQISQLTSEVTQT